jgi:hypothetical protein
MSVTKPTPKDVVARPVQQMPDFLKGTAGRGIEGIDASDIETPRLSLLQATSPQVTNFENARPGGYWHNMLNQPVGDHKTGFEGVIAFVNKRALLWRHRPPVDVGGILARSDNLRTWTPSNATFSDVKLRNGKVVTWKTGKSVDSSGLLEWGSSDVDDPNSLPAGTLMVNAVMFFPEYPHFAPAVFSFQRSSARVSRRLMGLLTMADCASYGLRFRFGSDLIDVSGNKFYIPTFEQLGYVENEDELNKYESLYNTLLKSGLKMREEPDEVEVVPEDRNNPAY